MIGFLQVFLIELMDSYKGMLFGCFFSLFLVSSSLVYICLCGLSLTISHGPRRIPWPTTLRHALGTLASLLAPSSASNDRPPCTLPQARLIGLDLIESAVRTQEEMPIFSTYSVALAIRTVHSAGASCRISTSLDCVSFPLQKPKDEILTASP